MDARQHTKLKVINLWAGPGTGKSTTAAGLFNLMKLRGERVELVTEVAKDLTWQKDYGSLRNSLYLLAMQDLRLRRLEGQVEWAITDSPLPLALAYASPEFMPWLAGTVTGCWDRYVNHNFLLGRVKAYQQYGRRQNESEAVSLDTEVRRLYGQFGGNMAGLKADYRVHREIAFRLGLWDGMDP